MKRLLVLSLFISMLLFGCSGGGDGAAPDPCAGPIPCLTEDWGNTFYEFEDQSSGDPVVLMSDGAYAGVGGFYYEGEAVYVIALAGDVIDCRNAQLNYGGIDLNTNGVIEYDELFASVAGSLNVCATILRVYDLNIGGETPDDVTATYKATQYLSITDQTVQVDRGVPTKLIREMMKRLH